MCTLPRFILCLAIFGHSLTVWAEDTSLLDYRFSARLAHDKSDFPLFNLSRVAINQAMIQWRDEFAYGFMGSFHVGYAEASISSITVAGRRYGVDFGYIYKHRLFSLRALFGYDSYALKDEMFTDLPELKWNEYTYSGSLMLVPHIAVSPIFEFNKMERSGESNIDDPGNFYTFDQTLNKLQFGVRVRTDDSGEIRALVVTGDVKGFELVFSRNFY